MSRPAASTAAEVSGALVLAAGLGALVLWGGTAIANKIAIAHMDAMTAGVLRSMLAGLIAGAIAFAGRFPFPKGVRDRTLLTIAGVTSFAIWPTLISLGLGATTAGHAALIMAMLPVTTGLIAALFDRSWPRLGWWMGVAMASAGVFLLVAWKEDGALAADGATVGGDLILLSGIAICSLGYVTGGRVGKVIGAGTTVLWGLTIAVLALVPAFVLLAGRTDWGAVGAQGWLAIAYLTLMSSLTGYGLWFWALAHGGIARVGSWQFLQPVVTLALAAVILGEALTAPLIAAAAIILAGTWFTQRGATGR